MNDDVMCQNTDTTEQICNSLTEEQISKVTQKIRDVLTDTGYGEVGIKIRRGRIVGTFVLIEEIEPKIA